MPRFSIVRFHSGHSSSDYNIRDTLGEILHALSTTPYTHTSITINIRDYAKDNVKLTTILNEIAKNPAAMARPIEIAFYDNPGLSNAGMAEFLSPIRGSRGLRVSMQETTCCFFKHMVKKSASDIFAASGYGATSVTSNPLAVAGAAKDAAIVRMAGVGR